MRSAVNKQVNQSNRWSAMDSVGKHESSPHQKEQCECIPLINCQSVIPTGSVDKIFSAHLEKIESNSNRVSCWQKVNVIESGSQPAVLSQPKNRQCLEWIRLGDDPTWKSMQQHWQVNTRGDGNNNCSVRVSICQSVRDCVQKDHQHLLRSFGK